MSGDGIEDVTIPSAFLPQRFGDTLVAAIENQAHMISIQGTLRFRYAHSLGSKWAKPRLMI